MLIIASDGLGDDVKASTKLIRNDYINHNENSDNGGIMRKK